MHEGFLKPRLTIRVGVIGNRDIEGTNRAQLQSQLCDVFDSIRLAVEAVRNESVEAPFGSPYSDKPPAYFLITSLAEGADQMAAEIALTPRFGYQLRCPLPFPVDEYKDFFTIDQERAAENFDRLISSPGADPVIFSLDCATEQSSRPLGYRVAADMLIDHSELQIAIHDPDREGRIGGTEETIEKALVRGIPVVRVNTVSGKNPGIYTHEQTPTVLPLTALSDLLRQMLVMPGIHRDPLGSLVSERVQSERQNITDQSDRLSRTAETEWDQTTRLVRFYREPLMRSAGLKYEMARVLNIFYAAFWQLLLFVGNPLGKMRSLIRPHTESVNTGTEPPSTDPTAATTIEMIQAPYLGLFDQTDRLASFYMEIYRGSFLLNYFLGALAVLCALLSYPWGLPWTIAEFFCLGVIFFNFGCNRKYGWQKRAVDYRFLAEFFRHLMMTALFGRTVPALSTPAHHGAHDPSHTWMNWYLRAWLRNWVFVGQASDASYDACKTVAMTGRYLGAVKQTLLRDWIQVQCRYHRSVQNRFRNLERTSRRLMYLLFIFTVVVVALHILGWHPEKFDAFDGLLVILAAATPAFLSAVHGVTVQGEFERLAERSGATADHLDRLYANIAQVVTDGEAGISLALGDEAVNAAHLMLEETLDWRIIYQLHSVNLT